MTLESAPNLRPSYCLDCIDLERRKERRQNLVAMIIVTLRKQLGPVTDNGCETVDNVTPGLLGNLSLFHWYWGASRGRM